MPNLEIPTISEQLRWLRNASMYVSNDGWLTWQESDLLFEDGKHIDGLHVFIAVKPWNTETFRGQQEKSPNNKHCCCSFEFI